ncbi:MAG: SMP-30/gluconolactonase/LRE family protein [Pseudomonadales bacterium]|nr:SMP-30/gluconolactonase/LRE family protein [Pseudomonadales bacterium]MBO6563918.1 SMP-30/gluconolactonase/LRE family protein [Pseudomonadales bacterium]MBO6594792.1 SMP-30/gluconolactonase/LRE family protein [Pseudomonadales bacterium]MBO6656596.1 SMP-30/gluconolactonase/LRE family protein [Pseudomonadales bacterium]MBO6701297.1 SMP-30/gluconolactonase/LRE family protein [Pseudomonadales bacterium]
MEKLAEGYGLVEGPVWLSGQGLLFSDASHGGAYLLKADGSVATVFGHRRGMGGMSEHQAGGIVVSGRNISWKSLPEGETKTIFDPDPSKGMIGFNDITTDASGRIYAGSLGSDPLDGKSQSQTGSLYLIDLDGSAKEVATDILLTNGLGISPDGKTLYHSDSSRRHVNRYEIHSDGTLGEKQIFVTTKGGGPDGLALTEDGRVWVALAGGGGVAVYKPDGELEQMVEIPQSMCTSVCFGGDDLKDLYIVSGSDGADSDRAGAVYRTRADVAGLPVAKAAVELPS